MNKAISKAVSWATSYGLEISKEKTVSMLFTNSKDYTLTDLHLKVGDTIIPLVEETKYLGITIDSGLTWIPHITDKISKAKRILFAARGAVGKLWGPKPEMMLWLWKCVVRPCLLYTSPSPRDLSTSRMPSSA